MTLFWLMRYDGSFVLEASGKCLAIQRDTWKSEEPNSTLPPDVVCLGEMDELLLTTYNSGVS